MTIKALSGNEPHESYGGWERFLTEHCDIRDQHDGVTYYGTSNCNYIVFPDGTMIENYGYHGRALMATVREKGAAVALAELLEYHRQYTEAAANLCTALDRLTNTLERAFDRSRKVQMSV